MSLPRRFVVISPHLDDAVYSLGQTIAALDKVLVVTCLAGLPGEEVVSEYDLMCGFKTSLEAVLERQKENARACAVLGAEIENWDFLDGQYKEVNFEAIKHKVYRLCQLGPVDLIVPLGITHPDHLTVADAAVAGAGDAAALFTYEELPYWVQNVEETAQRMTRWPNAEVAQLPQGSWRLKQAAMECYESQISDEVRRCALVPERVWRVR